MYLLFGHPRVPHLRLELLAGPAEPVLVLLGQVPHAVALLVHADVAPVAEDDHVRVLRVGLATHLSGTDRRDEKQKTSLFVYI